MDSVNAMISPYVEKDHSKFCTYEEFQTGISTLKEFCLLRAESISGQLDGSIGSTSDTQATETLIDAGNLQIEAMGSMNNTMGGGMMQPGGNMQRPQKGTTGSEDQQNPMQQMPGGMSPGFPNGENGSAGQEAFGGQMQRPDGNTRPEGIGQIMPQDRQTISAASWTTIGMCILVLAFGLVFAFAFKRRK